MVHWFQGSFPDGCLGDEVLTGDLSLGLISEVLGGVVIVSSQVFGLSACLSAAFDTVNHQILLSTLSSLDITGIPLHWFKFYLSGRSFRVAWGGEVSKAHKLVTGVPQGSALGPLLFSTYTTSRGVELGGGGMLGMCPYQYPAIPNCP